MFDYFNDVYQEADRLIYRPFRFKPYSITEAYEDYTRWRTYQMPDHLPMWLKKGSDFVEEYLDYAEIRLQEILFD